MLSHNDHMHVLFEKNFSYEVLKKDLKFFTVESCLECFFVF